MSCRRGRWTGWTCSWPTSTGWSIAERSAIPYAVEGINRAARSCRVGYVTNNSSRTAAAVAKQLRGFGLDAVAEDIVTSPQAAVPAPGRAGAGRLDRAGRRR